ncbi:M14 family zinc carboxypeptidase [Noviherbaspirillum autotrophicum]|uniref:M14 family zinc carboxypeptidase n=1 Tax=Noviherbaspirillum autotrophicum TaxID=709839 RepID=UPI000B316649|nr:M14 family zinc carboxypeptidase [Noviherbaspirillum autotrophicum]
MRLLRCTSVIIGLVWCLSAFGGNAAPSQPADWCKRLSARLPDVSVADCQQSALKPTGALSQKGFPILKRVIPAAKSGSPHKEPVRVLLLGGIHGDELTAAAIVFQWMQWMQTAPARDFEWDVAPVVNPDGLLAPKPQRVNANGVDLNRNFPTPDWKHDAPRYWTRVTRSDPRRFPGAAPLSEPETRWLNQEMERFRPHVIISVHAPFGVLDFDGPAPAPRRFGRLHLSPVGVYPGSLGNYSGVHKNVPVITIELPNALAMPPQAEVKRIWLDMLGWIARNVPQRTQVAQDADASPLQGGAGKAVR